MEKSYKFSIFDSYKKIDPNPNPNGSQWISKILKIFLIFFFGMTHKGVSTRGSQYKRESEMYKRESALISFLLLWTASMFLFARAVLFRPEFFAFLFQLVPWWTYFWTFLQMFFPLGGSRFGNSSRNNR